MIFLAIYKNAVAKHELIEIIRTNKDRVAQTDEALVKESEKSELCPIELVEEKLKMKFLQIPPEIVKFGIET